MRLDLADNYFDLFGTLPGFHIDLVRVESKYRELQSLLHPDRHATAGAQEKRLAAQGAALVNQAHAVLLDDCARAAYLLELKGVQPDLESNNTMHDRDFLMEQMELREVFEQSDTTADRAARLQQLELQMSERMLALGEDFSNAYLADKLDAAHRIVYKMQFIKKFHDEVTDKLHRVNVSSASG